MGEPTLLHGEADNPATGACETSLSQDMGCLSQLMLPAVLGTLLWGKYRQRSSKKALKVLEEV